MTVMWNSSPVPTLLLSRPSEQPELKTSNICFSRFSNVGYFNSGNTRRTKLNRIQRKAKSAYSQTPAHLTVMLLHMPFIKAWGNMVHLWCRIIYPQVSLMPGGGLVHSPVTHRSKKVWQEKLMSMAKWGVAEWNTLLGYFDQTGK